MPKATSEKKYNTFVKGFVTEASPLTYPENASLDEDNFVLRRNGSRERRLGLDYETGHSLIATGLPLATITGTRCSYHEWRNPNGYTDISIGVVRIFNKLWFFNTLQDPVSGGQLNGGAAITLADLSNAEVETTVINNRFVIVSSDLVDPISLSYDKVSDVVTQTPIDIQIRDLLGVYDGLTVDNRPTTLSDTHHYNLKNQGWNSKIKTTCGTEAIPCTFTKLGKYPSNADMWSYGKESDASASATYQKYNPEIMERDSIDNAKAAKGSYIIDAFSRGASRVAQSGIATLPVDKENGSITTITTFAGRVFYSGVISDVSGSDALSPNYSNYIFFSQVVTDNDKVGKCYQEADPTSPNISDIIDTDGGTIQIPEATKIVHIIATRSSLLVFAENGVWEVFGDTQGFVATSFQSHKISDNGCSSKGSIVSANGSIIAWTKAGIYAYTIDPSSGRYAGESISLTSIQQFYNDLSEVSKNNAKGFYDERDNTVRWLYNDAPTYEEGTDVNRYNRELVLDLTLQSFYPQSNSSVSYPFVADYVDTPNYAITTQTEAVYTESGGEVTLTDTTPVVIDSTVSSTRTKLFSFLTIVGTSFTFSKYSNRSFTDWEKYYGVGSGLDYSSYLLTGYEVFGDTLRHKQVPYIWLYFLKTEDGFTTSGTSLVADNPSSCLVQAQWNWCNSAAAGKWGTQFQAYRFVRNYVPSGPLDDFDNGDLVVVTKNKLRGKGRALSLLIQSEAGKDMKLLGWALLVEGGSRP